MTKQVSGIITKEASSPKKHHHQRGLINKKASSSKRHHRQTGIIVKQDSSPNRHQCQRGHHHQRSIVTNDIIAEETSLQNGLHHSSDHQSKKPHRQRGLITKEALHHRQRGFIIKRDSLSNSHQCQWGHHHQRYFYRNNIPMCLKIIKATAIPSFLHFSALQRYGQYIYSSCKAIVIRIRIPCWDCQLSI